MIQIRGGPKDDEAQEYPIFNQDISHANWLRAFVYDLLSKGKGENARMIFPVLARIIRGHDLSIATFILPFAALNVIITGDEQETLYTGRELLTVLETEISSNDQTDATKIKQCSEVRRFHIILATILIISRTSFKRSTTSLFGYKRKEKPSRTPEQ
jgi:serine/threonine-protein kinase ATR